MTGTIIWGGAMGSVRQPEGHGRRLRPRLREGMNQLLFWLFVGAILFAAGFTALVFKALGYRPAR